MLALDRTLTMALNGSSSLYWDQVAWIATKTVTWLPLSIVLAVVIIRGNDMRRILSLFLMLGVAVLLADQMASGICKPLFARFRPTRDPEIMYMMDIVRGYRGGPYGFFSSHAANTMALATFVALLIRSRLLNFYLYSWVLLNCWTRVYLGVHYVGDLTAGLAWGGLVGVGCYALWRRFFLSERDYVLPGRPEIQTSTGYAISDVRLLVLTFLLIYLYIAVSAFFVV